MINLELYGVVGGLFVWTCFLHVKLYMLSRGPQPQQSLEEDGVLLALARIEAHQTEVLNGVSSVQQALIALMKPRQ